MATDRMLDQNGAIAFVGLGMMGLPMACRLVSSGFNVRGCDLSVSARQAFVARGGSAFETAGDAAKTASVVITMLPDAVSVRAALFGARGAAAALDDGALVIDMSSSAPMETRRLAEELAERRIHLIDAPVSGGVGRATDGTLSIMAGGDGELIEFANPLFDAVGTTVIRTGPIGSGHAVKALNNYVSAAGLAAACEAAIVAEKFGIDPMILVDALNVSTGRNNSTEVKMKPFILSGTYASGFSMALMAKDLRTAADLAGQLGIAANGTSEAARLWEAASDKLGKRADHTEIHKFIVAGSGAK